MFKMLVMDLDGTLLNEKHVISKVNKENIRSISKNGVKVILASGREPISILPFSKELEIKDYIIGLNGAIISDGTGEDIIYEKNIPPEVAKYVVCKCEELNILNIIFIRSKLFISTLEDERVKIFKKYTNTKIEPVGKLSSFIEQNNLWGSIGKMLQPDDNEVLKKLQFDIVKKWGDDVVAEFSLPFFLEIYNSSASKGQAMGIIAEKYGIDIGETIAIGDGENDISMIEAAGLGVAMENALEIVKRNADYITLSNIEDGVSHVIRKYWLD